jgi:hypothetical protein
MMESLKEAMDDIHYANALHEGKLPPSRPILKLPDRVIQSYMNKLREQKPQALELETICSEPLGFYLVINIQIIFGNNLLKLFFS